MIQVKNIVKNYLSGDNEVHALKDVSINFRNSEFVSILGPSGCGKTTLLNIIGGLDKYTSGDIVIDGVSTKDFKDRDWDTYRNYAVGFVFQSYNLIPHQTVLQNVEIALTLSGVSKSERKERAIKALEEVGLKDQIHKKPNALSGGQMQRVAIARALVNNPEIILADEPTGALDSETSIQVMEILKKVAEERLVVMVTHNPELAEKYSTRIIQMLDGNILSDSKPYTDLGFKRVQNKIIKDESLKNPFKWFKKKKKKDKNIENGDINKENETDTCGNEVSEEEFIQVSTKTKRPSMSFWTAFKLSLKNLFTKKGRTALTSFAGSIGIIGIALILAVSQGTTGYIDYVQESTLASYPLTIEENSVDLTSLMSSFMNVGNGEVTHELDKIYKDTVMAEMVDALSNIETNENDLKSFKNYLDTEIKKENSSLSSAISGVQYSYNLELSVYTKNPEGEIFKSDTGELLTEFMLKTMDFNNVEDSSNATNNNSNFNITNNSSSMFKINLWQEMLSGKNDNELINKLIYDQYELVDGSWPNDYDEVVLIVNEYNELSDLTLYALGLLSEEDMDAIIDAAKNKTTLDSTEKSWTYDEIKDLTFKTILTSECYRDRGDGIYVDVSEVDSIMPTLYNNGIDLKIKGIIRPKKDSDSNMLNSGIGYTSLLTSYVINKARESGVVQAQLESTNVNVLTGEPFKSNTGTLSTAEKNVEFRSYIDKLNTASKVDAFIAIKSLIPEEQLNTQANSIIDSQYNTRDKQIALVSKVVSSTMENIDASMLQGYFAEMSDEQIKLLALSIVKNGIQDKHSAQVKSQYSNTNYTNDELVVLLNELMLNATEADCAWYYDNITKFSDMTYEEVLTKLGYLDADSPSAINIFASSFENKDIILAAIDSYNNSVDEGKKISYTDYIGLLMSSITTIIDAITYVLIAFVSISLVVSSIMIGVITLISVQERTKEIGILRAIGASKKDVSSMFNAETLIIGFTSGLIGVLTTYLLCIPINIILKALTGIAHLRAILPFGAAVILVLISMGLTLISGLIPSRSASKKDPVVALRTE